MKSKRPRPKQSAQEKKDNSAWRPGTGKSSYSTNSNILHARCDTDTNTTISFMINTDEVKQSHLDSDEDFAEAMSRHLKGAASYRPAHTVIKSSINGSPLVVATPNGRELFRDSSYGLITFYSDRQAAKEGFEASEQCSQLDNFCVEIKRQTIELTKQQQQKLQRERQVHGTKRKKSQNAEMKESAETHMQRIGITIENVKFEWLHLVAHKIAGAISQHSGNLVAATMHANTDMIFVENELSMLCKRYPDGVKLEVTAYLNSSNIEASDIHAASKIEYKISTPDFEKTFEFNGNNPTAPHISFKHYVHALMKALIPESEPTPVKPKSKGKTDANQGQQPLVSKQSFFSKDEFRKNQAQKKISFVDESSENDAGITNKKKL